MPGPYTCSQCVYFDKGVCVHHDPPLSVNPVARACNTHFSIGEQRVYSYAIGHGGFATGDYRVDVLQSTARFTVAELDRLLSRLYLTRTNLLVSELPLELVHTDHRFTLLEYEAYLDCCPVDWA